MGGPNRNQERQKENMQELLKTSFPSVFSARGKFYPHCTDVETEAEKSY